MKRGKKAQFYIIGAVIIIIAIMSMASVTNYVLVKKEPKKFIDLGNTINLEGGKVLEYATYNDINAYASTDKFLAIMGQYIAEENEKIELVIIRGNATWAKITVISQNSTGTITLNAGKSDFQTASIAYFPYTRTVNGNNVTVTIRDINYTRTFDLSENNNFIIVMTKSEGFYHYVQSTPK